VEGCTPAAASGSEACRNAPPPQQRTKRELHATLGKRHFSLSNSCRDVNSPLLCPHGLFRRTWISKCLCRDAPLAALVPGRLNNPFKHRNWQTLFQKIPVPQAQCSQPGTVLDGSRRCPVGGFLSSGNSEPHCRLNPTNKYVHGRSNSAFR
jgi:hypothetical protein